MNVRFSLKADLAPYMSALYQKQANASVPAQESVHNKEFCTCGGAGLMWLRVVANLVTHPCV